MKMKILFPLNIYQIQQEFDKSVLSAKVTIIHNRTLFDIYFYIKKETTEKIDLNLKNINITSL